MEHKHHMNYDSPAKMRGDDQPQGNGTLGAKV